MDDTERTTDHRLRGSLQGANPELRDKLARQLNKIAPGSDECEVGDVADNLAAPKFDANVAKPAPTNLDGTIAEASANNTTELPLDVVADTTSIVDGVETDQQNFSIETSQGQEAPETDLSEANRGRRASYSMDEKDSDEEEEGIEPEEKEVSDTDSEPLEYRMLSVANHMPMPEVEAIFQKVKRQEEKNIRLQQKVHDSTPQKNPGRESPMISPMKDVSPIARDDSSPLKDAPHEDFTLKKAPLPERLHDEVVEDDGDWWDDAPPDDTDAACVPPRVDPPRSRRGCLSCRCCCTWLVVTLSIMGGLIGYEPSDTGAFVPLREYLPQQPSTAWTFDLCTDPPCNANTVRVTSCTSVEPIEDRLRCFRLQASARREWLQSFAKIVVNAIALFAVVCLLMALLYWRFLFGAIVAVLAGAVLFVLVIIATEGAMW